MRCFKSCIESQYRTFDFLLLICFKATLVSDQIFEASLSNESKGITKAKVIKLWCESYFIGNADPAMMWFRADDEKLEPKDITLTKESIW